jgi:hypothetical protein
MSGFVTINKIRTQTLSNISGEASWTLPLEDGTDAESLATDGNGAFVFRKSHFVNGIDLSSGIHSGLISGGQITINKSDPTQFDISVGKGVIINDDNRENITVKIIEWDAKIGLETPWRTIHHGTWIGIDIDGNVETNELDYTPDGIRYHIRLGRLSHWGYGNITTTSEFPLYFNANGEFIMMAMAYGTANVIGNVISANGANLMLDKSHGICVRVGANANISRRNPNMTTLPANIVTPLRRVYRDGNGCSMIEGDFDIINPSQYDDNSGTLKRVKRSQYTIQTVIIYPFNKLWRTFILYGQKVYKSYESAVNGLQTYIPIVPDDIFGGNTRAFIIVPGNCENLTKGIEEESVAIVKGPIFGNSYG